MSRLLPHKKGNLAKIPLFQIAFHEKTFTLHPLKAAYLVNRNSILAHLFRIHPREWFVILGHELYHLTDTLTHRALERFLKKEASSTKNWLLLGLHTSLLAETRAWTWTFQFYLAEKNKKKKLPLLPKRKGLIPQKIAWLEEKIQGKKGSLPYRVYQALVERLQNTSFPLIQKNPALQKELHKMIHAFLKKESLLLEVLDQLPP